MTSFLRSLYFYFAVVHMGISCKKVWEMFVKGGTLGDTDSQELWPALQNNNSFLGGKSPNKYTSANSLNKVGG